MSQFGLHHRVHHTNAGHTALLLPLALGSQAVLDHTEENPGSCSYQPVVCFVGI